MFCKSCGAENDDNAYRCVRCNYILQQAAAPPLPPKAPPQFIPNYLAQAILVTLFCCMPFGIVAIVYAAQVNGKAQAGDIQGALDSSSKAKMWCWISFGIGFGAVLVYFLFIIGLGATSGL